jgi:hypothetical protein
MTMTSATEVMTMLYVPRPHQQIAAEFLRTHKRAGLFLDMGL